MHASSEEAHLLSDKRAVHSAEQGHPGASGIAKGSNAATLVLDGLVGDAKQCARCSQRDDPGALLDGARTQRTHLVIATVHHLCCECY